MNAAWASLLLVLGSLSLATAWEDPTPALCLAAAAVLPLVVCRAVLRLGVSPWATAGVTVSLLVLGAYVLTAGAGTSFSDTVSDAVPRLLTTTRPLPARADVLVGPLLLTSLVSVLVAVRLPSERRVAPVVGGLALYVAGALLTTGEGDPWGLLASLLLACALVGWVVLDERRRVARRLALALPAALTATGLLALATTMQWSAPFEPRSLVDPPSVDVVASNPLAQLGAWSGAPDQVLLEVTGPVVPLRLVTLDTYDGDTWTSDTDYEPLPESTREPGLPPGSSTRASTVRVETVDLEGRWLPSPGRPTEISTDRALVEPVSGNLYLPTDGATSRTSARDTSLRGLAYTVTGIADSPDQSRLASATVPGREDLARYLSLPPLPPELSAFAERSVAGAVTPYDRAVAIEAVLHDRARLSSTAVSGSQLWRITTFLLARRGTVGARTGTAEQFATSFALMARHNGLPTRVVVGFRPDADAERSTDGWSVRGRHATAWAEVYFEDLGWVSFFPTDERRAPRADPEETVERGGDRGGGGNGDDPALTGAPDDAAPADRGGSEAPSGVVAPAMLAAGAVAALLGLLLLARRARSWRHLRRGPGGAWAEARDALRLAGIGVSARQSADEVAALAGQRLETDAVHVLAAESQRAAFGPPGTDVGDLAPALRVVRRVARHSVPLWRRWWWPFDPSVFFGRPFT